MFDFNKLGEMAKVAGEAKKIQAKQEKVQREQIDLLKKLTRQMDEVISLLKKR
ncbi:MAG: hypothetical protein GF333_03730 [Candidatus Omnitrophica bacterium]|nr:hypothetical protein [Candidatus Omnitrophota bacterium]